MLSVATSHVVCHPPGAQLKTPSKKGHIYRKRALSIALGREPSPPPHTDAPALSPRAKKNNRIFFFEAPSHRALRPCPTTDRRLTDVAFDAAKVRLTPTASSIPPLPLLHPDKSRPRWNLAATTIVSGELRPCPANRLHLRRLPPQDPPSPTPLR
jgi:hypothetical protein